MHTVPFVSRLVLLPFLPQVGAYRLLRERHVEFKGGRYMELVQKQGGRHVRV